MSRVRRLAVLILCIAGSGYALLGAQKAADSMSTLVEPTVSEPWAGGRVWSVDTEYLDWVRQWMKPGDNFTLVDGTGNIAIASWTSYQLYPAVQSDPSEAEWAVLYGIEPQYAGQEVADFTEQITYAHGFHLLKRPDPPTGAETGADGQ